MKTNEIQTILRKISNRKLNGFIKSPINYTGNKLRILDQLIPHMPENINLMIDLFCGGATVGLNVDAKKIIFIDNNPMIIGLLKHIACYQFEKFIDELLIIINDYGLSLSSVYGYSFYKNQIHDSNPNNGLKQFNELGYYKLRHDYNNLEDKESKKAYNMLYLLMVYAFNNDIRFSKSGQFNLPIGKTDLNLNNLIKLKRYIDRINEIECEFICSEFNSENIIDLIKDSNFIYMDPPYLITTAVYNESNKWNNEMEYKLLEFIKKLVNNNKYFMLSNIIEKKGKRNEPLYYWTVMNKELIEIKQINYHYRNSSYNKINRDSQEQEIIIIPRRLQK